MDMSSVLLCLMQWMGDIVKCTLPHGSKARKKGSIDHLTGTGNDVGTGGQDHAQ